MKFVLEDLPYSKDALEPYISARTLEYHYEKHHRGYMEKLEKAIGDKPMAKQSLEEIIAHADGSLFNHAAQVWNHDFYWKSMSARGGGNPPKALAEAIRQSFGGVAALKNELAQVAKGEFGSGWAWLILDRGGKLGVLSTTDAENPLRRESTPLLTIDVWEHAYYLDYQNERGKYVEAVLDHLLNWDFAARNMESAREHLAA